MHKVDHAMNVPSLSFLVSFNKLTGDLSSWHEISQLQTVRKPSDSINKKRDLGRWKGFTIFGYLLIHE